MRTLVSGPGLLEAVAAEKLASRGWGLSRWDVDVDGRVVSCVQKTSQKAVSVRSWCAPVDKFEPTTFTYVPTLSLGRWLVVVQAKGGLIDYREFRIS